MESTTNFEFRDSEIFTEDEISELYKIFKIIDQDNIGKFSQTDLSDFMKKMYQKDVIEFNRSDLDAVNMKITEYLSTSQLERIDFDMFLLL